ncbi:hypothetical protein AKJ09_00780 [Labilithrix luteola]|uniref:Uncharacterized protein n=1 Tax=Labilithrix luteola TaxID=1391654 RepID=A0A0K1PL24_9BACT|nr:hypothetical protein AKJ09_00780 [Labilithrix luteola]
MDIVDVVGASTVPLERRARESTREYGLVVRVEHLQRGVGRRRGPELLLDRRREALRIRSEVQLDGGGRRRGQRAGLEGDRALAAELTGGLERSRGRVETGELGAIEAPRARDVDDAAALPRAFRHEGSGGRNHAVEDLDHRIGRADRNRFDGIRIDGPIDGGRAVRRRVGRTRIAIPLEDGLRGVVTAAGEGGERTKHESDGAEGERA